MWDLDGHALTALLPRLLGMEMDEDDRRLSDTDTDALSPPLDRCLAWLGPWLSPRMPSPHDA